VDFNKVFLSGVVETEPILSTLPQSGTPLCYFTLRVDEKFLSEGKTWIVRPNYFRVECLGRQATSSFKKVRLGGRYFVDGYLRQENSTVNKIDIVKVRSYGVVADPSMDAHHYRMGLKKAVGILYTTKDVDKALDILEVILDN
jgi:single-stranded DNA-binding protein